MVRPSGISATRTAVNEVEAVGATPVQSIDARPGSAPRRKAPATTAMIPDVRYTVHPSRGIA